MAFARRWVALTATLAVAGALAGAGVFASAAPAARAHAAGTSSCGNHSYTLMIEVPERAPEKLKTQAKNVHATNVSCKAAFKFIEAAAKSKTGTPEHYKCKIGKAKEPRGYFPELCTHGSKKIEYGQQGG